MQAAALLIVAAAYCTHVSAPVLFPNDMPVGVTYQAYVWGAEAYIRPLTWGWSLAG